MFDSCNQVSLTDASVKLSYEEFEKKWQVMITRNPFWNKFEQMFVCLDFNGRVESAYFCPWNSC